VPFPGKARQKMHVEPVAAIHHRDGCSLRHCVRCHPK
jgi:hypothetical protein